MATGIVSLDCHLLGWAWVARGLFWLNIACFVWLLVATLARVVLFPRRIAADLADYHRGVGFFTLVAACSILGSQAWLIAPGRTAAIVLWWVSVGLWLVLTYAMFGGFVIEESKQTLSKGIHGGWMTLVVSTQSCFRVWRWPRATV